MKAHKTIFDHIGSVLITFGFSMIIMMIFCRLFGEEAGEISTMFQFGNEGIALETMFQYLVVACIIEILRSFFFSDRVIRNLSLTFRTAGMLISVIGVIAVVVVVCGWFPVDMWLPWVMFLISFGICFLVGLLIGNWKEKLENRKMEEGLERLKKELEEEGK